MIFREDASSVDRISDSVENALISPGKIIWRKKHFPRLFFAHANIYSNFVFIFPSLSKRSKFTNNRAERKIGETHSRVVTFEWVSEWVSVVKMPPTLFRGRVFFGALLFVLIRRTSLFRHPAKDMRGERNPTSFITSNAQQARLRCQPS